MRAGAGLALLMLLIAALALTFGPAREDVVRGTDGPGFGTLFEAGEAFPDSPAIWDYRFPQDHGGHADQFGEHWLFVGRLEGPAGDAIGLHLAFYRLALSPEAPPSDSAWAARQIYRAQLVIDGPQPGDASSEERFSRDALGLAGASHGGVWLEDWSLRFEPACNCFELRASANELHLALALEAPANPPVRISGIPGLDIGEPGMHGYWWPRLKVHGQVRQNGQAREVEGTGLIEHFWGRRLPVARGQMTLNRLWLELEGDTDVRCLQLRRRGGGGLPLGGCLLLAPDGELTGLAGKDLQPAASSRQHHPLAWTLRLPTPGTPIAVEALRAQPPLDFRLPTWSGLVQASGGNSLPIGWGWLELGGY